LKTKTIGLALSLVAVVWFSWTVGSHHGQRLANQKCGTVMKEVLVRVHSSSVSVLPTSCEPGDFVFNLTESKFYMCISPAKWVYPNYARFEKEHGEPR
jgi:hypothetical protein